MNAYKLGDLIHNIFCNLEPVLPLGGEVRAKLSKIVIYDNIVTMTILSLYCRDNIVTIYDNKTIGFFNLRKKYFSKQKMLAT